MYLVKTLKIVINIKQECNKIIKLNFQKKQSVYFIIVDKIKIHKNLYKCFYEYVIAGKNIFF